MYNTHEDFIYKVGHYPLNRQRDAKSATTQAFAAAADIRFTAFQAVSTEKTIKGIVTIVI